MGSDITSNSQTIICLFPHHRYLHLPKFHFHFRSTLITVAPMFSCTKMLFLFFFYISIKEMLHCDTPVFLSFPSFCFSTGIQKHSLFITFPMHDFYRVGLIYKFPLFFSSLYLYGLKVDRSRNVALYAKNLLHWEPGVLSWRVRKSAQHLIVWGFFWSFRWNCEPKTLGRLAFSFSCHFDSFSFFLFLILNLCIIQTTFSLSFKKLDVVLLS